MTSDALSARATKRLSLSTRSINGLVAVFVAKWYAVFVVSLWVFIPELRRLIDWQIGYNSISFVNLLPLLSLLPPAVVWLRRRERPGGTYGFILALIGLVLVYGLYISWASSDLVPGIYELMQFLLPIGFALWFAKRTSSTFTDDFDRFCTGMLVVVGISAVYGLVQFASPPPWDVVWVVNSGLGSIGEPVPFGLRVFGTLNAPGPFADMLYFTILLNIRFVQKLHWWRIALLVPIFASFALTLARSQWLALVLGLIVYGLLTPQRKQFLGAIAILAICATAVAMNLDSIFGSSSGANQGLATRLTSFGNLDSDDSAEARQELLASTWNDINSNPLGAGLGATGTAAKLSNSADTVVVDNGFVARLLEFGYIGFIGYLVAILLPFTLCVRAFVASRRTKDVDWQLLVATCVAVQVSLLGIEASSDHHVAFSGLVFWLSVACVNARSMSEAGRPVLRARPT